MRRAIQKNPQLFHLPWVITKSVSGLKLHNYFLSTHAKVWAVLIKSHAVYCEWNRISFSTFFFFRKVKFNAKTVGNLKEKSRAEKINKIDSSVKMQIF